MPIPTIYLLYGLIALCAVLLVEGLFYLIADNKAGARSANRRMRMLDTGGANDEVYNKLRRAAPDSWENFGPIGPLIASLNKLLGQSGLTVSTGRVVMGMVALSVLVFAGVMTLSAKQTVLQPGGVTLLLAVVLSLAVGIGGPVVYLLRMKAKRMKLFAEQLPDALDMMVRSLRVGHPVSVAIALAAKQMPDPMGTELGIAVDEMTYGLELQEALANMGDRVEAPDFQFVVVAITIQHDTGGNLAEALNGLATVIRSRFRMFKKVRSLAAEGRFSAKILGALPFAFALMTFAAKPQYYLQVAESPLFFKIMLGAVVLQAIGIFVMHKMINFRF